MSLHLAATSGPLFAASTSRAVSLYVGCPPPLLAASRYSVGLRFMMIGVAGSSALHSAAQLLADRGFCRSESGELNFYAHRCFAGRPPSARETDGYLIEWHHCRNGFDSSPEAYVVPWAPLRVCQSMGRAPTIFMMLRNPVARAWSGFRTCVASGALQPPNCDGSRKQCAAAPVFTETVRLDAAIARTCEPWASGAPEADLARGRSFAACCEAVANDHGIEEPWAACSTSRQCAANETVTRHRARASDGAFGRYCAGPVRAGVYVKHLQLWYRHHRPENVLLTTAEAVLADKSRAMDQLAAVLRGHAVSEVARRDAMLRLASGATAAAAAPDSDGGAGPLMNADARDLLDDFYAPFNAQLEALLGRRLGWGRGSVPAQPPGPPPPPSKLMPTPEEVEAAVVSLGLQPARRDSRVSGSD